MNRILDHSVNVISFEKNGKYYSMCCAWSMNVDYDKVVALLGAQSITGKNILKGDIIGFASLEKNEKDIDLKIGENHSDSENKLEGINIEKKGSSITICNAKSECICEVIDVLHLDEIEEDNLIYLRVLSSKINDGCFLHMEDF